MKALTPYVIAFVLLVLAAWYLGAMDPINGAVAEAHASESTGSVRLDILSEAFALIFHLTTGGIVVTAVMWLIVEGGKLYRRYWLEKNTRRWTERRLPREARQSFPKLSREDVMLYGMMNQQRQPPRLRMQNESRDDEIDLSGF